MGEPAARPSETSTQETPERFGARAGDWLAEHLPEGIEFEPRTPQEELAHSRAFQAALYDAGFAGITWPIEYGGRGLGQVHQQAFNDAVLDFSPPVGPFIVGLGMCGPTLADLGTEAQKQRYLRPLLRGEEIWCQLFSEPGAGSDVASLQSRAVRDGDGWVLDGQKVWTTGAHVSDFGAILVRTDPDVPKHQGLTMFVLDMRATGVTVRPLRDMTGRSVFNEVFLDGVRLPADSVIGEVGQGWAAAVTMLGHERVFIGGMASRRSDALSFTALAGLAAERGTDRDPVVRERLARLYAQQRALSLFTHRMRQEADTGRPPGARGSVAKLVGALNDALAVEISGDVTGPTALAWDGADTGATDRALAVNGAPSSSIAGGTNEIQRNIIGERVLGLPKEPSVDRGVPFRELRVGTQKPGTE
ncbi:acyl-CoA dehydrogenase family protein [Nocardiopsis valliformis]|uniref:acyl-CoA dehydrogenase family protein n=1 Tax=Nocardiopsis valliformis TaxID=239974 RepID=UPI000349A530|nr:acyl-CoA dehydrogenase family protein [Nocardiopsis valliformis]